MRQIQRYSTILEKHTRTEYKFYSVRKNSDWTNKEQHMFQNHACIALRMEKTAHARPVAKRFPEPVGWGGRKAHLADAPYVMDAEYVRS